MIAQIVRKASGIEAITSTGVASNTVVSSGGSQTVNGIASNTTVSNGGVQDVGTGSLPGGLAISTTAYDGGAMYDPKGTTLAGMAGIDMACYDIMGKALGVPVHKLIGGLCRDAIEAYASDLHWQENPADMARASWKSLPVKCFQYSLWHYSNTGYEAERHM